MIINDVSKSYLVNSEPLEVLKDFSLTIEPNTICALVGPSGCGKTTLLRLVGELEACDKGSIVKSESELGPVSYLFQEPRLLPWFSVLTNVEVVLRPFYENKAERVDIAMKFIKMVGLGDYAKFKPDMLSGGMRQRVAIARSFAYPSSIMLLDEPFQSLDASLRWSLVKSFLHLWEAEKRTTLYVTHDVQEALLMADLVIKLSKRPMEIINKHYITTPKATRSLADPKLISLQASFYN